MLKLGGTREDDSVLILYKQVYVLVYLPMRGCTLSTYYAALCPYNMQHTKKQT